MQESLAERPYPPSDGSGWAIERPARRPARLSVMVVDVLVDRIVSGAYPADGVLPTEPVLCQLFEVSRSVIREALTVLEEKGLARIRQGQGTTVTTPDEWNILDSIVLDAMIRVDDSTKFLDELVDVRVALESDMAKTASQTMRPEDLAQLEALLAELRGRVGDAASYQDMDVRYHDFIMRCSGNRLGRSVIRTIHPHARASTRYNPPADDEDIRQAHAGHVAVYERLLAGDGEGAAAVMQEHIRGAWNLRKLKRP